MQYIVNLGKSQDCVEMTAKCNKYIQYTFTKKQLQKLLKNWINQSLWIPVPTKSRGNRTDNTKYHSTAIARKKPALPIRDYIAKGVYQFLLTPDADVDIDIFYGFTKLLYYGIGRDTAGLKALGRKTRHFQSIGYDPFHPKEVIRTHPKKDGYLFHEIHCHYVLNIVDWISGENIIKDICKLMHKNGVAIISVRNDLY